MRHKYNIYEMMLRAAAGEGAGGVDEDPAAASANAPTINADDPEDPPPAGNDTVAASGDDTVAGGEDTQPGGEGDDTIAASGGDDKPPVVPRAPIMRRIGELTKKVKDKDSEIAALRAETERLRATRGEDGEPGTPQRKDYGSDAEFRRAVQTEAARQRAEEEFGRQCAEADQAGEKAYGKAWEDSVENLKMLSDTGDVPLDILNAALNSDDPAKVLHELGQDPERAAKFLMLPPVKRIAEAVKMGLKAAPANGNAAPKPKPKSNAPAPVEPIGGSGGKTGDGLGDDIDDATWLRNRNAQLAAQRGG